MTAARTANPGGIAMSDYNVNGTDYSLQHVERFDNGDLYHFQGRRGDELAEGVWFGIQVATDLSGAATEVHRYAWTPDEGLNVWKVTVSPCSPDLVLAVSWAEAYGTTEDLPEWVEVTDFTANVASEA